MLSLANTIDLFDEVVANLSWHSGGALMAFSTYMYLIGVEVARHTYHTLYPEHGAVVDRPTRIAGLGMLINLILQSLVVTLGCGFATATATEMTGVSIDGNKAMMSCCAIIWVWTRLFGQSPWLSRVFSAIIRRTTG